MASEQELSIDRREAIRRVSALLGGVALVGGSAIWTGCARDRAAVVASSAGVGAFTPPDIALLDDVADTILPETSTPGARAAHTGAFMAMMVTDCYDERDQKIFKDGMAKLDAAARTAGAASFTAATPAQRLSVLEALDREQKAYMDAKKPDDPAHYFRMMKELALLGYFTSEIGYTKAQRYVESPGRFDSCVPYHPGDKAWAPHA
ncbi:MAG TPA: gluconate 2-dehydrogenase subunit 3 family protein [Gemmatimonadaceae bacterium]|nr:gluconate 2-dehydrogenase subunit 3 family protein [Gemmatimonadaceae bacterium]